MFSPPALSIKRKMSVCGKGWMVEGLKSSNRLRSGWTKWSVRSCFFKIHVLMKVLLVSTAGLENRELVEVQK